MKKILRFISILSFAIPVGSFAQQDIHFSQFYSSPTFLNPGSTGLFNGNIRAMLNYRSQWKTVSDPFSTFSASLDSRLFQDKLKSGFFGAGIVFYNDVAGASKLTTGNYALNISYALEIEEDMYLSLGVQPGFLQKSINYNGLLFGNQWTGLEFNSGIPGEYSGSMKFMTFDLAAGLYYNYRPSDDLAFYAGVSGAHLTAPSISFLGATDNLIRKFTIHGGAEIAIPNSDIIAYPNFLVKLQSPNRIINFGSDFKYVIKEQSRYTGFVDEVSAGLGLYYRAGDAFWGTLQFNYTGFTLALSYDINISDLTVASKGLGGMEIMLMYRAGIGNGKGKSTRFL